MKLTQPKSQFLRGERLQLLLLLVWFTIGGILRFHQLASKPPWSDEFATLVFSLGHSFRSVPLDQVISINTLHAPLNINPVESISSVVEHLRAETNHPPGYFLLNHLWLKLFSAHGDLVSLWTARALSALLGTVSIPVILAFGTFALRSPLVGQIAAALMAVSPYGIYLAQEARHYTLAILLTIASLSCLIVVLHYSYSNTRIPTWLIGLWVIINSLGMGVHYFFILVLGAEGLSLLWLRFSAFKSVLTAKHWQTIYAAAAGTLMGVVVWLPVLPSISSDGLTEWIHQDFTLSSVIEPVIRILLWTITMVLMLPVEGQKLPIIGFLGLLTITFLLWSVRWWVRGCQRQMQQSYARLIIQVLLAYIVAAIAFGLAFTYGLGIDVTLAARYQFIYFPAVLLLLAVSLAGCWQNYSAMGKRVVVLTLLIALVGGLSVSTHLAYQKPDRPDLVINEMIKAQEQTSRQQPVLIATVHKTHEQTGEMMGLAWELTRQHRDVKQIFPQFLLAHKHGNASTATKTLHQTLTQLPHPLDLWIVNFSAPRELETQGCLEDPQFQGRVSGYYYRLYHCT
ncbi:MAG: glycosyltransferase [Xenococcaceae cyanobacterium]